MSRLPRNPPRRRTAASSSHASRLEARRTRLVETIKDLTEELEFIDKHAMPDPFDDGAVITFDVTFASQTTNTKYTYVAVRANGLWYSTGRELPRDPGSTWDSMLDFFFRHGVRTIWWVPEVEELVLER